MKIKSNGHKCAATIVANDVLSEKPSRRSTFDRKARRANKRKASGLPTPTVRKLSLREKLVADIDWFMHRPKR